MKLDIFSYRFAEEITQHPRHGNVEAKQALSDSFSGL